MERLAMFGGERHVTVDDADRAALAWPIVTDAERQAVLAVLDGGGLTSVGSGAATVSALEAEWADYVGVGHCAAVASGTAAIEVALAAAGVSPGAEILVPALSFVGSASAPVARLLVPVFVDVDPRTYTIDPLAAAAAVTPRTEAVLAVHLHGLPCDMAPLRELARQRDLVLVEDAAQAHGASYRGTRTGALGDVAAFSLNAVKNLPTCGEGGLVTTDDEDIHRKVVRHRQFGEDMSTPRDYLSHVLAGNAKLSAVQAAFARCQLDVFPARQAARERNVREFLARLAELPGLVVPSCPDDRTHAWHMLRLRFDPVALGFPDVAPGALRTVFQRALRAEGVPVQQYQPVPLPGQPAFQTGEGFGGYPWRLPGVPAPRYRADDHPHACAIIDDSVTLQHWHLNPAATDVLRRCADAFEKVWSHRAALAALAAKVSYQPMWQRVERAEANR